MQNINILLIHSFLTKNNMIKKTWKAMEETLIEVKIQLIFIVNLIIMDHKLTSDHKEKCLITSMYSLQILEQT